MTSEAPGRLRIRVVLAYALPAFVVALPTIPVYIHLPALYGIQLGLGLATTGYVLLAARLFDTVSDPVVGLLCDRLGWRGYRRKPWIAVGAVLAGIGLFQVLNPPNDVAAAYLLGWSILLYAGWTMVAVPYFAWGAELSADYHQRTRITSWREGIGLIGILGAGALTATTAGLGWSERESIGAIAWAAILLGAAFVPLSLWIAPEAEEPREAVGDVGAIRETLRSLRRNKPFLRLLSAWFLNGLANGIPAALFFIYLEHGLGANDRVQPAFVLTYFLAAVASVPIWRVLSGRIGKHRTWCWAMVLACGAFVTVPWIEAGGFIAFGLICLITGMALGADLVLPPSIQADVVDYGEWRTGRARAGIQFALWGMSTKLSLAVAIGLALPGLDALGFDPAAPNEAGRNALIVIYALAPVVIKVMAVAVVWRFPLTVARQAAIRRRLDRRGSESDEMENAVT